MEAVSANIVQMSLPVESPSHRRRTGGRAKYVCSRDCKPNLMTTKGWKHHMTHNHPGWTKADAEKAGVPLTRDDLRRLLHEATERLADATDPVLAAKPSAAKITFAAVVECPHCGHVIECEGGAK